jgi:hypothetical protein
MGMSSDEFERQKADETKRFYIEDAGPDGFYKIVDRKTGKDVGHDGGEPEDQLLVRDWHWVVDALNAVADEGSRGEMPDPNGILLHGEADPSPRQACAQRQLDAMTPAHLGLTEREKQALKDIEHHLDAAARVLAELQRLRAVPPEVMREPIAGVKPGRDT